MANKMKLKSSGARRMLRQLNLNSC